MQLPAWRNQPALAIAAAGNIRLVERLAIPQLARHLLVHLVEPLAVVRERAAPDAVAVTLLDLQEPVGIGERLPRGADRVGLAAPMMSASADSRIRSACSNA